MQAGLVDHHAQGGKLVPPSALVGYKHVTPGEIVMNRMRAAIGLFATASREGLVSPDYAVFRPVHDIDPDYAVMLFRTPAMASVFRTASTGLGTGESGFLRLYSDQFSRLQVPAPPLEEQTAMLRFLDWANGRLERAIRANRKVIALLTEQKQVIVQRAITRGLDPDTPLKESGIPWLGRIPKHWELRRLRQIAVMKPSKSESSHILHADGKVTFLPMERVGVDGSLRGTDTVKAAQVWNGFTYFRKKDVLIAKITPCFENGKGAYLDSLPTDIGFGSSEFHVVRPGPSLLGAYLRLITSSKQFLTNGTHAMTGSAGQQRVPTDFVKNYPVALPDVAEQQSIVDAITRKALGLEQATSRLKREIDLLREYRTRLIADVVAGQLDVRDAAARLPDVAIDDDAGDPVDDLDEPELDDEETPA